MSLAAATSPIPRRRILPPPTEPTEAPTEPAANDCTLGNSADGNAVLAVARGSDGSLERLGTFPTGGLGTGKGLGSQAPIAISDDRQFLYVVNPGSNDISSFQIFEDHLSLISITDSGGLRLVSLTLRGDRLYVECRRLFGARVRRRGRLVDRNRGRQEEPEHARGPHRPPRLASTLAATC